MKESAVYSAVERLTGALHGKQGSFALQHTGIMDRGRPSLWARRADVEGFPACHLDDIIASKTAANRVKDRESLPRLRAFRDYWVARRQGDR